MCHIAHSCHHLPRLLAPALLLLVARAPAQIVFEPPTTLALAHLAQSVITADLDGDGHADLVSMPRFEQGFVAPRISVLLGAGDGSFGAPIVTVLPTTDSGRGCAALIDGDAHPDLALAFTTVGKNGVTFMYGDGSGGFTSGPSFVLPPGFIGGNTADVLSADLTGDGLLDFVIVEAGGLGLIPGRISALVAAGGGRYALHSSAALQFGTNHAAVGDVTGDGLLDVVASNSDSGSLSVLAGLGNGLFAAPVTLPVGGSPRGLVLADVDGDGPLDVALADAAGQRVLVLRGNGAGQFTTLQSVPVPGQPAWLTAGALDGDGHLDLLVSAGGNGEMVVLRGAADGTFAAVATVSHVPAAGGSALADVDEDGMLDAAVATFTAPGTLAVLRNHTYAAGSPFTDLGHAFPGANGYPIQLADGTLQPGTLLSFALHNALPGALATLYVGLVEANLPFKGGTLVPLPLLAITPLPVDGTGAVTLAATWPAGVAPGISIALQFWFKDPGAASKFAGSNAVRLVTP